MAEHSGWCGKAFAQQDGSVIGLERDGVHVVFQPNPGRIRSRGTLAEWQEHVAGPVARHPIPAFAIMAAFLPAVLRFMPQVGNVTLEFVGPADTGKSIAQKLAASVVYPPDSLNSCRDVQRDLQGLLDAGSDYPLFFDYAEPTLLTATKPKKAELYAAIAFDLPRAPGRRITILSGREPLREACGVGSADETVLTLRTPGGDNGVFHRVSRRLFNPAAFADSLIDAARAHHGHAYPELLKELLDHPSADKIKRRLARFQSNFQSLAKRKGFVGYSHRTLRTVGAIYAAGRLAVHLGVLPADFQCREAALAALGLNLTAQSVAQPFRERLEHLVASGQLLTLDSHANTMVQAHAALDALGTLTIKPTGRVIKISRSKIVEAFPDWEHIKRTAEVRALLKVDGKNLAAWGHLAPGTDRIRLFQFELPPAEEPTLFGNAGVAGGE